MYLVHQIIACILYAHLDLNRNWRQRHNQYLEPDLASAFYHDDVVTKVGFDKR